MIPGLDEDIGELLPTLAAAAIQTTVLVQLAMGGKFCKVALRRTRM